MESSKTSIRIGRIAGRYANILLVTASIGFTLILIFMIVRMRHLNQIPGVRASSLYTLYAGISAAGILVSLLALKLSDANKINIVLAGISFAVSLYLIELLLFLFEGDKVLISGHEETRNKLAHAAGVAVDARTKLQVLDDLIEQGIEAYTLISPNLFLFSNGMQVKDRSFFPLGGISQSQTVFCNEQGEYVIYESDEHGFNNPSGVFADDEIDVVLLGDSFAHGNCVQSGEDIGSQLRKTGKRVINLAMDGNGPLLELASLKEFGEPMAPKVVLWTYYERNDIQNLVHEKDSSFILRYLEKEFSQHIIEKQDAIDQGLKTYFENAKQEAHMQQYTQHEGFYFSLMKIIKLWHVRNKLHIVPEPSFILLPELFEDILRRAKALSSSWGGTLYFVYLPDWSRYAKNVEHECFMQRDQILSIVQKLEIPIIDIHKVFLNHPDPLSLFPYRISGHYTAEGYKLTAHKITEFLETHH